VWSGLKIDIPESTNTGGFRLTSRANSRQTST
jgi:hypothetical protein